MKNTTILSTILMSQQNLMKGRQRLSLVRGMEEFRDQVTKEGDYPFAGRAWKTVELRLKSFEQLHQLWYILAKERNMLLSEREAARGLGEKMNNPSRLWKVKKSMARLKGVV